NDHAQHGDPGRPDPPGPRGRTHALGSGARISGAALSPEHADRGRGGAGDGPVVARRVGGPDGLRDHGRTDLRHGADVAVRAGALRGLVPDRTTDGDDVAGIAPADRRTVRGCRAAASVRRAARPLRLEWRVFAAVAELVDAPG